ncbi:uncharacterized protein LOC136089389 [Hydra vulgaris]|uniref:uncharacterized protein LOC136089389 n=1 Tax=Hydra vulgaris TaxID=6087 RepID=UPI0032EA638B
MNKNKKINQSKTIYKCPFPWCQKEVFELRKHFLTKRHNLPKSLASKAVSVLDLRKKKEKKRSILSNLQIDKPENSEVSNIEEDNSKRTGTLDKKKYCPLENCMAVIKRVDDHLKNVHKIYPDDDRWKTLNSTAMIYERSAVKFFDRSPIKNLLIDKNDTKKTYIKKISEDKVVNIYKNEDDIIKNISEEDSDNIIETDEQSYNESGSDDQYLPEMKESVDLESEFGESVTNILNLFLNYLVGPDCNRNVSSCKKTVSDVKRMLVFIGGTYDITKMFTPNILRDKYLNEIFHLDPGSKKKYLFSIINLCNFFLTDEIAKKLIDSVTIDRVVTTKNKLIDWRRNYNRQDRKNFWTRQERNHNSLVTKEEISLYMNSKSANLANTLFLFFEENQRLVTQTEYISMRDHLFVIIHFSNAHRSGVSANVTIKEFEKAVVVDEKYIISVKNHKTFEKYGHANISFTKDEFQWLHTFVYKIRTQIKTFKTIENIFLSWTGLPMDSGAISTQLASLWKKAGISRELGEKRRLCATVVRQTAVTGIRQGDATNKQKQQVADLMGHSVVTADKHYHLRAQKETAGESSNTIRKAFGFQNVFENPSSPSPSKKRCKWLKSDINKISESFCEEISDGTVKFKSVLEKYEDLGIDTTPKKLYNKVNSLIRKTTVEKSFTPQRQVAFCKDDIILLHKSSLIDRGKLSKEIIVDSFQGTKLMEKFSWEQLRTRINYERSKIKKEKQMNDSKKSSEHQESIQ